MQHVAADAADSHADTESQQQQLQQRQPSYIAAPQTSLFPATHGIQSSSNQKNNDGDKGHKDTSALQMLATSEMLYHPSTAAAIAPATTALTTAAMFAASPAVVDAFGLSNDVSPRLSASSAFLFDTSSPEQPHRERRLKQQHSASLHSQSVSQAQLSPTTQTAELPPVVGSITTPILVQTQVAAQPLAHKEAQQRFPAAPRAKSATAVDGGSDRAKRNRQTRAADISELTIGDSEEIPSIGKFDSPRTLYAFKERVREFERVHGSQWREKMDSRRRQNWSRISAVYNRILQLRGPSTEATDVERAFRQLESEMSESKVTLTRYSQLVRKRLNDERRQSTHQQQQQQQQQ
ncbi:hypothetical protein BX070DRAFT_228213, partial [Coemansia spiralis]